MVTVASPVPRRPIARPIPLGRRLSRLTFYLFVGFLLIPIGFVFYWMVNTSLKPDVLSNQYPPIYIPTQPTLANYVAVFQQDPFAKCAFNSFVVGLGSTILALVLGLSAAYAIANFKQQRLAVAILVARMTPGISYLVPWFILFTQIGWIDTYRGLILTHLIVSLPIVVWIMVGFFEDLPEEVEEAALIDGASKVQSFWLVALPLTLPGTVATAILAFIFSWNNFVFSLILSGPETKPLPVAVFNFMTYGSINWGGLAAAATLITLPVLLMTLLVQKHIVKGLTFGAVKG